MKRVPRTAGEAPGALRLVWRTVDGATKSRLGAALCLLLFYVGRVSTARLFAA